METELQDLHLLSGSIFSNISNITPYLRNMVVCAKTYQKSYQATIASANQFVESIDSLAQIAVNAKGATRLIGETLSEIKKMFGEIEDMKHDLMKLFISEVIIPLESKAEQEINMSKLALKQYLNDNKIQTEVVNKATHDIVKVRKKSQRRKSKPGKYEMKEEEMLNELLNSEKKLLSLRQQGLRRALIGERRIYCFIGDRLCSYGRGLSVYSSRIATMLGQMTSEWDKVISRPSELPEESEEIIAHPSTYNTATIRKRDKYHTLDSRLASTNTRPKIIEDTNKKETENVQPTPPPPPPPPIVSNGAAVNGMGSVALKEVKETKEEDMKKEETEEKVESNQKVETKKHFMSDVRFSMIEDSPTQKIKQISAATKKQLIALYDHNAKDSSQLSFSKGDKLKAISDETSGWQFGENTKTGKTGWFPAAYVECCAPAVASKPGKQNASERSSSSLVEKTRRVSTPAQFGSPYIPAPDYDIDELDCSESSANDSNKQAQNSLHVSMSAPAIKINGIQETDSQCNNNNPSPLMPLAAVMKNNETPNKEESSDISAMPFPPPPPDFAIDDKNELENCEKLKAVVEDNPFASVKLKKTITNDRSNPIITT